MKALERDPSIAGDFAPASRRRSSGSPSRTCWNSGGGVRAHRDARTDDRMRHRGEPGIPSAAHPDVARDGYGDRHGGRRHAPHRPARDRPRGRRRGGHAHRGQGTHRPLAALCEMWGAKVAPPAPPPTGGTATTLPAEPTPTPPRRTHAEPAVDLRSNPSGRPGGDSAAPRRCVRGPRSTTLSSS